MASGGGHARAAEPEAAPQRESGGVLGEQRRPGSAGTKSRAREEMGQGRNFKASGKGLHGGSEGVVEAGGGVAGERR